MTELRFHRALYDVSAVDEAVKLYERFGASEKETGDTHWVVRVTAATEARERKVSRELANYALGLSIKGMKQS
jgi:hypothetical protein